MTPYRHKNPICIAHWQAGYRDSDVMFVPVSGLSGENLVQRTDTRLTAWSSYQL